MALSVLSTNLAIGSLPLPNLNQLPVLLDLYQTVSQWLPSKQSGMYEILDYDSTLELLDTKGEITIFKKLQRVKFLQNNIIAFQDYAWGDGDIFTDYKCSPGVVVDRYREGDRWNILISLRSTKSKGEIEDFYIERTIKNGYTQKEEWQQVEIRNTTDHLQIGIIFPKQRHCQRAILLRRSRTQTTVLGQEHFHLLPDGRMLLSWEARNIHQLEIYTIKWWW